MKRRKDMSLDEREQDRRRRRPYNYGPFDKDAKPGKNRTGKMTVTLSCQYISRRLFVCELVGDRVLNLNLNLNLNLSHIIPNSNLGLVNNLLEVDLINETFKPDLSIVMDWADDGEIDENNCLKRKPSEMWKPYIQFGNNIEEVGTIETNTDCYLLNGRPVICKYGELTRIIKTEI